MFSDGLTGAKQPQCSAPRRGAAAGFPPRLPRERPGSQTPALRAEARRLQPRPPFHVKIRHPQFIVQLAHLPMKLLILLLLPLGSRRIAEKYPATKRPKAMHPAQLAYLKRAPRPIPPRAIPARRDSRRIPPPRRLDCRHKRRQFHRTDIQPMPIPLEMATFPRSHADRPPLLDSRLKLGICPMHLVQDLGPLRSESHGKLKLRLHLRFHRESF
jgi:hypothetical protein